MNPIAHPGLKCIVEEGILMRRKHIILCSLFVSYIIINSAQATDWLRWRGSDADGIFKETNWNPNALDGGPKRLWKTNLGIGFSSISVQGHYLYSLGNNVDEDGTQRDIVYCLDTRTGKVIWQYSYPCDQGGWPGPRATPTIDGSRVYTLSRAGHLFCFDNKTGKVLWNRNIIEDGLAIDPDCGISGSPVVHGDLLILNAGRSGLGIDKRTGQIVWDSGPHKCGFATPVLYQNGNNARAAILGRTRLYSVDVNTGRVVWSIPWKTRYEENSPDPVILGNRLFISTGYGKGCALYTLNSGQPTVVWQNRNMSNHFHTCVILNGYIYGIHGVTGKNCSLRCLDFKTGDVMWEKPFAFGPVMAAGDKLIILTETGHLHIAEASPQGYREISSANVIDVPYDRYRARTKQCKCWIPPVLSNGRMFVRNSWGDLICLDMR